MTDVTELETLPTTNAGVLGMGFGVGEDTGSVAWWEAARADWSSATFGVRLQQIVIANETTVGNWPRQAIQGGGHLDLYVLVRPSTSARARLDIFPVAQWCAQHVGLHWRAHVQQRDEPGALADSCRWAGG